MSTTDKLESCGLENACENVLEERNCPEQREQSQEHAEEKCHPVRCSLRLES